MIKKIVKGLWVFFALMVLAGIAVFASIAYGWIGYMPPVEELENPNYKFATEILSEDGKVWVRGRLVRKIVYTPLIMNFHLTLSMH